MVAGSAVYEKVLLTCSCEVVIILRLLEGDPVLCSQHGLQSIAQVITEMPDDD